MNVKASDAIAYARKLAPTCEYVYAGQGTDRDHDGLIEVDCVGFMNVVLGHFDVRTELVGPTRPYKVRWYYDHWRRVRDKGTPDPGDLVIIGDPLSTGDAMYRHIGMVTDSGYISALNESVGVQETTIPTGEHDRIVWVLRTGFLQDVPTQEVDMADAFTGTVRVSLNPSGSWFSKTSQAIVPVPFPAGRFTEPPVVIPGLLIPVSGQWQKLTVRCSGGPGGGVTVNGFDMVVNTADGSKVTAVVDVPYIAFGVTS